MESAERPTASGSDLGRVRLPLWLKLGAVFGLLLAGSLAAFGWLDLRGDLAHEAERRRAGLLGLGQTMAAAMDGDELDLFRKSADAHRPEWRALRDWLAVSVASNDVLYVVVLRADERGRLSYVAVGDEVGPLPPGFPVFDIVDGHHRALAGEAAFTAGWSDEWGRYDSAFAPIRDSSGQVVAVLELDTDAEALDWFAHQRVRRLLVQIGVGLLLCLAVSAAFARALNRHLGRLTRAVLALAGGDLDQRVAIDSHDEIGLLGRAFDRMAAGLREREFIRETFGRFVDPEVAARVLRDPAGPRLGGELRTVTVLISDLRGFTSLAESLEPGPLVELLNRYLSRMEEVIHALGGVVNEFTGDGIVAFFGAPEARPDDLPRALACAVRMQMELSAFNAESNVTLQMGIGVNVGPVVAGNIGSHRRMKYSVVGDAINLAARLEAAAVGGQVLVSAACVEITGALCRVGEPMRLRAKGKREPISCFPLLGLGPPWDLRLPRDDSPTVAVDLTAVCRRVEGKQEEETVLAARVARLGPTRAVLEGRWSLALHQHLRLVLTLADGRNIEDLYGKVVALEQPEAAESCWSATVSFTSVPGPAREALRALAAPAVAGAPRA